VPLLLKAPAGCCIASNCNTSAARPHGASLPLNALPLPPILLTCCRLSTRWLVIGLLLVVLPLPLILLMRRHLSTRWLVVASLFVVLPLPLTLLAHHHLTTYWLPFTSPLPLLLPQSCWHCRLSPTPPPSGTPPVRHGQCTSSSSPAQLPAACCST
jgi:hypothetical protein